MGPIGKLLIFAGIALIAAGLFVTFGSKLLPLGRLPGDLVFKRGNATVHIPIVTSVVISILLTLLLNLFFRR